ncbi:MAG TPA: homoserine kinase [Thermoplasmata archaeon]|nr:homoserine kinase [Thermoplasmata archaeon]
MASRRVSAKAPATIANVGPGFDVFCLAIRGPSDAVSLREANEDSLRVEGPEASSISTRFTENTAGIVVNALRRATGVETPLEIVVTKGIPAGRGLGSSAASCAAAALAFLRLYPETSHLGPAGVLQAAVEGEAAVAGRHYDNLAGALLGGFVVIASTEPIVLAREPVSPRIHLAVAVPDFVLKTAEMRRVLPETVSLRDAVSNVGKAATLALALSRGDAELAGRCLEDRFAEPKRAPLLSGYGDAKAAALRAGAAGFAISGSGSSVFAIAASDRKAEQSAKAMQDAFRARKVNANAFTSTVDNSIPLRSLLGNRGPRFSLVTK